MKYLIVNGDDFGGSRGINRGILDAHHRGILTSASLLVTMPWSNEAARLVRAAPGLSVGLHVQLPAVEQLDANGCRAELERQWRRFEELMGCPPTHVDSHYNIHRDVRVLPHLLDVTQQYGVPLRGHCSVRYLSKFYGQWGGRTHLEQISVESLCHLLRTEVEEGVTELSCHPGYADPDFRSGYSIERETEVRTLCAPNSRQTLVEQRIRLVSFQDLGGLALG